MIRLNAFFEVKDNASVETVKKLGTELVNESRKDDGNISYDLFLSPHGLGSFHTTCTRD